MSIEQALRDCRRRLASISDTPFLDAQVIISTITGKPRTWVLAHPEALLSAQQNLGLMDMVFQVENGLPLPYAIKRREFFNLAFTVTPATLIPRPETELLVEYALAWLEDHPASRKILDMGTGSGCIAVSLAVRCPQLQITAVDVSLAALKVAYSNAQKYAVQERIKFVTSSLFTSIKGQYELILANLPYIPTSDLINLPIFEKEPTLALDGGPDGLQIIRDFLQQASRVIAPGGLIVMEIEYRQGNFARQMACSLFPQADVQIIQDLAGLDRFMHIQFPNFCVE